MFALARACVVQAPATCFPGMWNGPFQLAHGICSLQVPHDQPLVAQAMIEQWADKAVGFLDADVKRAASTSCL